MTEAMKFLALLIGTAVCSKLRRWWKGCDMMQWLNDFQTRWVWSLSLSNAYFGYIWSYSHFVCAAAHINSLPLSYGPLPTKLFCFDVAGKIDWSTIFCRLSGLPIANVHSFTKKTCSTRGYVSTLHCRGFVTSHQIWCQSTLKAVLVGHQSRFLRASHHQLHWSVLMLFGTQVHACFQP